MTRPLAGPLGLAVGLALLASACTGSGYHYVKDSKDGAYFKVPESWKLYDENDLLAHPPSNLSRQDLRDLKKITWAAGFDANPAPSVKNILSPIADIANLDLAKGHPVGMALVRPLSQREHDSFSLRATRSLNVPIDAYVQAGLGKVVDGKDFSRAGGFRGEHVVAEIPVDKSGHPVDDPMVDRSAIRLAKVDQTVITDSDTSKLYVLFISCSDRCYDKNKDTIKTLVDSWTVRET